MIGKPSEYAIMHQSETELWWYKYLHDRALRSIAKHFGSQKSISVLDAGCGTGGLLLQLKTIGYSNQLWKDAAPYDVSFANQKTVLCIHSALVIQIVTSKPVPHF